jgi:ATP-binding protein involved in chromosome partitioning
MATITEQVMQALSTVIEPELHRDIVSLNMVRDLTVRDGVAAFTIVLTTPACPLRDVFVRSCNEAVIGRVPGIERLDIRWDARVPTDTRVAGSMAGGIAGSIRSIVAVHSGKGGVGKSTVSTNLAVSLAEAGARVGLMDADILNPNLPMMTGAGNVRPRVGADGKIVPIEAHGVKVISTGFLSDPSKPMIMRGPMLHSAIRQFFNDVNWGELDYMIVDLPPGTGDAPLSLAQSFPLTGALIVTQPQDVAISDALRSAAMFETLNVPILGIIENMAGDFFGSGGGEALAQQRGVPFLGRIPLDAEVRKGGDYGRPVVVHQPDTAAGRAFTELAQQVAARISVTMLASANVIPLTVIE